MQTAESRKRQPEIAGHLARGHSALSSGTSQIFIIRTLADGCFPFSLRPNAQETSKSKPEPLMIQEQGSFAVGGKVITNPRNLQSKAANPAGNGPENTARRPRIRLLPDSSRIGVSFRWCFCTAQGSFRRPGRPLPMAERASRRSFSVAAFRYI